jgi:hypothetical protein
MKMTAFAVVLLGLAGCAGVQRDSPIEVWDDMKRDGKYKPQAESKFFEGDHRASRRPVAGTVAHGHLNDDEQFSTGILPDGKMYVGKNPLPINAETLKVGQAKFNTYCSPCHSRVGDGKGIVAIKTPAWQPSNLHEDRVKGQPDGMIYNTISYGRRSMPGYRFQIPEHDRWAIVAYVRAIQRTSSGTVADVPADLQAGLKEAK